jgi:hypothetical protein
MHRKHSGAQYYKMKVNPGRSFMCVNRRKGNKENIPAMKDCNGGQIIDPVDKANVFLLLSMYVYSYCLSM